MGKLMMLGIGRLDAYVEHAGEDGLLELVVCRVLEGRDLVRVADELKVPYSVLWGWLGDGRMGVYRQALEGYADRLVHESLGIVDGATQETLQIAKLQAEHRLKLAAKWGKGMYGDGVQQQHGAGAATINIVFMDAQDGKPVVVESEA